MPVSTSQQGPAARRDRRIALSAVFASAVVFFAGLILSASAFYAKRSFDWTQSIISDLESPEENPTGYLFAALTTALCGVLLVPLIRLLHRRLAPFAAKTARAGSTAFGAGAFGAVAIGVLAPFPVSYDSVHVPLAFLTFIGIVAGIVTYLTVFASSVPYPNRPYAWFLRACLVLKIVVLGALIYLYFVPNFFTGTSLWTTLALWEWCLCIGIVAYLLILVDALTRAERFWP